MSELPQIYGCGLPENTDITDKLAGAWADIFRSEKN